MEVVGNFLHPDSPLRLHVVNIIGGGSEEWAVVELKNVGKTNKGMDYNQTYCWCTRWKPLSEDDQGKIVQVRAYLDTGLVDRCAEFENIQWDKSKYPI